MKSQLPILRAAIAAVALLIGATAAHAQGFGGNTAGTPGLGTPDIDLYKPLSQGRAFNDLELTAITRIEENTANHAVVENVGKLAKAASDARAELVKASLSGTADSNALMAKAKALGDAELAASNARAANLTPMIRKELPGMAAARLQAVATNMETRAVNAANAAAARAAAATPAAGSPAAAPATPGAGPGRAGRGGQ